MLDGIKWHAAGRNVRGWAGGARARARESVCVRACVCVCARARALARVSGITPPKFMSWDQKTSVAQISLLLYSHLMHAVPPGGRHRAAVLDVPCSMCCVPCAVCPCAVCPCAVCPCAVPPAAAVCRVLCAPCCRPLLCPVPLCRCVPPCAIYRIFAYIGRVHVHTQDLVA